MTTTKAETETTGWIEVIWNRNRLFDTHSEEASERLSEKLHESRALYGSVLLDTSPYQLFFRVRTSALRMRPTGTCCLRVEAQMLML